MYKRKFEKGDKVENLNDLWNWARTGGWFYWQDKVQHPGWLLSMTIRGLGYAIERGILFYAHRREC